MAHSGATRESGIGLFFRGAVSASPVARRLHSPRAMLHAASRRALSTSSIVVIAALAIAACGGSVASPSDGTSSSGGGAPAAPNPTNGGGAAKTGGNGGAQCDGLPDCDPGDHKVASASACPQDDARCYSREACGTTIWCTGSVDQCTAVPTCPSDTVEVKTCPRDTKCIDATACGVTIHCAPACEGPPPICEPGDKQVKGPNDCPQDASCYSRTTCNVTIWCTNG